MHVADPSASESLAQPDETPIASTYRQGDVLIISAPNAVADEAATRKRIGGRVVLALGEATGHAHAIADVNASLYGTDGTDCVLRIGAAGATLVHEEHAAIDLPAGTYIVRRQREYVPGPAVSTHVID
jgi:hypothetical protein